MEIVLGGTVDHVTIEPDEEQGTLGHSERIIPEDAPGQHEDGFADYLVNRILVTLAAQEAELLIVGQYEPEQQKIIEEYGDVPINSREIGAPYDGDNTSLLTSLEFLASIDEKLVPWKVEEDGTLFLDDTRVRQRCRELLRENRQAVERVAAALVEKTTLTGNEVEEIIEVPNAG